MDGSQLGGEITGFRVPPGAGMGSGRRPRVFLYSHDTYGLGHLRRNLAIAEELLDRDGAFDVWLLTGSPVIRSWDLPAGLHVQPLPPVVKLAAGSYGARAGEEHFGLLKGYREALILKTVLRERPDIFIVDHAPAGMKGELLSTLALIRRELPETRMVLGLRDILDEAETVRALWREEETYDLLARAYHHVLVYGCQALFDVAQTYAMPPALAARVRYTGYVARPAAPAAPMPPAQRPHVLVTAGGGGDGFEMMQAFIAALALLPRGCCDATLLTGPLMPAEQYAALENASAGLPNIAMVRYSTDISGLMGTATLVVSMGGYNTSVEILAARKPAIIVPRTTPRLEQKLRADMLARHGVVWTADPGPGLAQRLADLLPAALSGAYERTPDWSAIDLNGARRVGDLVEELAFAMPRPEVLA
ncbi:MAG: hypothetical protein KGJ41_03600 [Rhodospirillales bacterium]|nr:hypothetical protein [Rhodospirillales bacterium]MDE2198085.1 hypothetical protein [Rhodospirillales bacterium]MDE2573912.1 hypothetical protein [Rhodospirillales bacterium]